MNNRNRGLNKEGIIQAPAYPHGGAELFRRLRAALTDSIGFQPGFPRLARIVGANTSLTHYWFKSLPHRHLVAFLALLEHLPENRRTEWVNAHCRELPRVDHSRIAHDPLAVSALEDVLRATRGISWICGGSDFHRSFLIMALGHSAAVICGKRVVVTGFDIHPPRKLVPVETVLYLREPLPLPRARAVMAHAWPEIRSAKASLVLLNGMWSIMPELQGEILELAQNRHVVVSIPQPPQATMTRSMPSTRVITLSSPGEHDGAIRFQVETL